jgi:hypothetical protein
MPASPRFDVIVMKNPITSARRTALCVLACAVVSFACAALSPAAETPEARPQAGTITGGPFELRYGIEGTGTSGPRADPDARQRGFPTSWRDHSPHAFGELVVNGVRLQYLDWGGTGDALVLIPHLRPLHVGDAAEQEAVRRWTEEAWIPFMETQRAKFESEMRNGHAVMLDGGNHMSFPFTHEREVVQLMRDFLLPSERAD